MDEYAHVKQRFQRAAAHKAMALGRRDLSQREVASAIGVPASTLTKMFHGRVHEHWPALAAALDVPPEWLRFGHNPPDWARAPAAVREAGATYAVSHQAPALALVGTVTAGDGLISHESEPRQVKLRDSWALMRVEGRSAYPVVFPNQFVVVDTKRPIHHNNLVVIQVLEAPGAPIRAYLKRYCVATEAPHGYMLASINSGRDTPYIHHEHILVMLPVVGVLFEDPELASTSETEEAAHGLG